MKDGYNRYIDKELDRRAAGIKPEYATGGVEYYDKLLARNVALRWAERGKVKTVCEMYIYIHSRDLQGDIGRSTYTGRGDVIQGLVRQKSASITERRNICAQQNFIKAS